MCRFLPVILAVAAQLTALTRCNEITDTADFFATPLANFRSECACNNYFCLTIHMSFKKSLVIGDFRSSFSGRISEKGSAPSPFCHKVL